ncbi:MAG TPA: DUF262 domain-containing HNH endonuclease family protein [Ilumatobacter sp.]|nr:DUF262 domain-containing HNH endonuclease family protein [Ilumatobacter sp.]
MDATTHELRSILGNERRFLIPTFQRDYEWTKTGQWQLLFDDLVATAGRLAAARSLAQITGESASKAEKRVAPHFLGAVVLDQLPSNAGQLDRRAVIDGQQRLTTIQLLIRALADVAAEAGSSRVRALERLVFNPVDDPGAEPDSEYKLWPRRHDRDKWRAAMGSDPAGAPLDHLYGQARAYFAQRAREATAPPANSEPADATIPVDSTVQVDATSVDTLELDTLLDATTSLFKVVSIDLDDNDDAQVIFEVLNGRQTPLSAADLVKNLLFLRAEVANEHELEQLHDRYWAPLESAWWKASVGRGHAARQRRELLLAAWLTVQTGTEASVGHLYGGIRQYIVESDRSIADLLVEISQFATAYGRIASADPEKVGERAADAYRRINLLGVTLAQPLLLWIETRPPEVLTEAEREIAVTAVESWIVRRLLAKRNTRGYGRVLIGALNSAKRSAAQTGAPNHVVLGIIDSLDDDTLEWPSDDLVLETLTQERFYDYHSKERIRMVLAAIDRLLVSSRPKSEHYRIEYDKLQIEHLMPQAWQAHWPLDPEAAALPESVATRERLIQTIGNLTLLTSTLNPALSNGAWSQKEREISAHSKLQLNSSLGDGGGSWDESAIVQRSLALTQETLTIWPAAEILRSKVASAEAPGSSDE